MFFTLSGVAIRILSNSYLNVLQKILTLRGEKASVVNFYTYLGLSFIGLFILFKFGLTITNELLVIFFAMGLLGALGNYFIIKALSLGELSSLAPINSYKPIVALFISFFLLRELPSTISIIGIILIIFGTYFLFSVRGVNANKKAIRYRILALIFSGSEAVFIKKVLLLTNVPVSFALWAISGFLFSTLFIVKSPIKISSIKYQLFLILIVCIMQYSTNFVFARMNVSSALALFQLSTLFSVYLGANIFKEQHFIRKFLASVIMVIGAVIIIL